METHLQLKRRDLPWKEVEGEIVSLDVPRSVYLSANRTGAVLWQALARGTTRKELVGLLTDRYEVDASTAGRDVDAFLEELAAKQLLESAS